MEKFDIMVLESKEGSINVCFCNGSCCKSCALESKEGSINVVSSLISDNIISIAFADKDGTWHTSITIKKELIKKLYDHYCKDN